MTDVIVEVSERQKTASLGAPQEQDLVRHPSSENCVNLKLLQTGFALKKSALN